MRNHERQYTVKCSNCGKEQQNNGRAIIRACSLCGGTHLTDAAQQLAKDGAHLDPIDHVVKSDAHRRALQDHTDLTTSQTTPTDDHPTPDFFEKTVMGMNTLLFYGVIGGLLIAGYWGMMVSPDPSTAPPSFIIGLGVMLTLLVGTVIAGVSTCYVIGDIIAKLATDRAWEGGENDD